MSLPSPTTPALDVKRVELHLQTRCNPLQGLDPLRLGQILNAWRHGHLVMGAELFEFFAERDIQLKSVYPKRKRAVSSLSWQVVEIAEAEASPETIARHTAAANHLIRTLVCTRALNRDERGGIRRLVNYLMEATLHGWSPCEVAWTPVRVKGGWAYQVHLVHIPVRFFEATSGKLRFLEQDYGIQGKELEAGRWMVHTADALGPASAVACMLKGLSLRDWIGLCERYGFPIVHGKTDAAVDSPEWRLFESALLNLGKDGAILTNRSAELIFNSVTMGGENPQQALVNYLDKAQATLWRGGDLSTFSGPTGDVGAIGQQKEAEALEDDDAEAVSETIQHYLIQPAIQALFGEAPAVTFRLRTRNRVDTTQRLAIYEAANRMGVQTGVGDFREEFDLPAPSEQETEFLKVPAAPVGPGGAAAFANAENKLAPKQLLLRAYEGQASKLIGRLNDLPSDPAGMRAALEELLQDLPKLLPDDPAIVSAWEHVLADAMIKGVVSVPKV